MRLTFTKIVVIVLMANGIAWTWCSYYLAYVGRIEIAETLSTNVVKEILGVALLYCIKATIENVFKYNQVGGESNEKALERDC